MTYLAVTDEEDDPISDAMAIGTAALATGFILNPQLTFGVTGWGVRAIASHPVTIAAASAAVVGGVIAHKIDPGSGLTNYVGFITGGNFGEEDVHYFSGDPNDSGYFNLGRNIQIIGQHHWDKTVEGYSKKLDTLQEDAMKYWIGPKPFSL